MGQIETWFDIIFYELNVNKCFKAFTNRSYPNLACIACHCTVSCLYINVLYILMFLCLHNKNCIFASQNFF